MLIDIPITETNSVDLPAICASTGAASDVEFRAITLRQDVGQGALVFALAFFLSCCVCLPYVPLFYYVWAPKQTVTLPLLRGIKPEALRWRPLWLVYVAGTPLLFWGLCLIWVGILDDSSGAIGSFAEGCVVAVVGAGIVLANVLLFQSWRDFFPLPHLLPGRLDAPTVALDVHPEAAKAYQERLYRWTPELGGLGMTVRASPGALCKEHPTTSAVWTCGRCGNLACETCTRRVRPDAMPICVECDRSRPVVPMRG